MGCTVSILPYVLKQLSLCLVLIFIGILNYKIFLSLYFMFVSYILILVIYYKF